MREPAPIIDGLRADARRAGPGIRSWSGRHGRARGTLHIERPKRRRAPGARHEACHREPVPGCSGRGDAPRSRTPVSPRSLPTVWSSRRSTSKRVAAPSRRPSAVRRHGGAQPLVADQGDGGAHGEFERVLGDNDPSEACGGGGIVTPCVPDVRTRCVSMHVRRSRSRPSTRRQAQTAFGPRCGRTTSREVRQGVAHR